jgi:hypothetical protein
MSQGWERGPALGRTELAEKGTELGGLGRPGYGPRNFTGTSQPSPLPALWAKTSYL